MTTTIFNSPKTLIDLQNRMVDAMWETADETAKQFEQSMHQAITTSAKLRATTTAIAREAFAATTNPAAK
jgi:hypothetical protein